MVRREGATPGTFARFVTWAVTAARVVAVPGVGRFA